VWSGRRSEDATSDPRGLRRSRGAGPGDPGRGSPFQGLPADLAPSADHPQACVCGGGEKDHFRRPRLGINHASWDGRASLALASFRPPGSTHRAAAPRMIGSIVNELLGGMSYRSMIFLIRPTCFCRRRKICVTSTTMLTRSRMASVPRRLLYAPKETCQFLGTEESVASAVLMGPLAQKLNVPRLARKEQGDRQTILRILVWLSGHSRPAPEARRHTAVTSPALESGPLCP
jgi:hypothetical protein